MRLGLLQSCLCAQGLDIHTPGIRAMRSLIRRGTPLRRHAAERGRQRSGGADPGGSSARRRPKSPPPPALATGRCGSVVPPDSPVKQLLWTKIRNPAARSRPGHASFLDPPITQGRRECRELAAPMARLQNEKQAAVTTRFSRIARHSLHDGFNGVLRALPGKRALLLPSRTDRSARLTPASGCQDHATSPCAMISVVRAKLAR
jgi:hypothetical protein